MWWYPSCHFAPKTEFPGQILWPYFALCQNWLTGGFGLSSPFSKKFPLLCCPTWWHHQYIASVMEPLNFPVILQVLWSLSIFQCSQTLANTGAVIPLLGQLVPGVLDASLGEHELWPAFCCWRNGEKCISNDILLPWTPVHTEAPVCLAQQHPVMVWLCSGRSSPLSVSISHRTYAQGM